MNIQGASAVTFLSFTYKKTLKEFIFYYIYVMIRYTLNCIFMICTFLTDSKKFFIHSSSQYTTGCQTFSCLQKDITNLSKLPKHMGYLINEDVGSDNYSDLSNLVVWAIALGIQNISLYDRHGILKSAEVRLGKIIREKVHNLLGLTAKYVILKNDSTTQRITYSNSVCVHLLSEEDGKPDILAAGKKITSDYCTKKIKLSEITIDYVDKYLEASENVPDPDLLIQFGPVSSLLGFLPWQTRLTEILHVQTHVNLSFKQFYGLLEKYSKCDQRFGR